MKPTAALRRFFSTSTFIVITLSVSGISRGAALTWDGGNTTNAGVIDPGDGTWDTTAGNAVWNNATANVAWTQTNATTATNSAIFGGADGTYAITVAAGIATSGITFNNSGYTLTAANAQTITSSNPLLVATGKNATVGGNVTFQRTTASVLIGATGTAMGTLNIAAGGTVQVTATQTSQIVGIGGIINVKGTLARTNTADNFDNLLRLATVATDDVTINVEDGGKLNVGGRRLEIGYLGKATVNVKPGGTLAMTSGAGGHLYSGFNAGNGALHVTGGTVTTGTVGEFIVGGGTSTGVVTISGGTVTSNGRMALAENGNGTVSLSGTGALTIKSTSGGMNFSSGANSTTAVGTFHLNGGVLTTPAINKISAGLSTTFNFNGGTLKPNKANSAFMTGLNTANVHDGGAIIDTNGFDITIAQALTHSNIVGANPIDGGLTKLGSGDLTISNSGNTYTGQTTVSAGSLVLDNVGIPNQSGLSVGVDGTLKVKGDSSVNLAGPFSSQGRVDLTGTRGATKSLAVEGGISLNNSTLNVNLFAGGVDDLSATGTASNNGVTTINLTLAPNESVTSGTYTVLSAAGGLNGANFAIGTKPAGFSTYTLTTPTPNELRLKVVAGNPTPATAYWTGAASRTGSPADASNSWGYGSALATTKSNWSTNPAGTSDPLQIPGAGTNVIFSATNATGTAGVLTTRLDSSYSLSGLTIDVPASTGITSTVIDTDIFPLMIAENGIILAASSNANAAVSGGGSIIINADQSWANNSNTQSLTISPTASAASNLTVLNLNGTGTGGLNIGGLGDGTGSLSVAVDQAGLTTFSGSHTYTGTTDVISGKILLENLSTFSSGIIIDNAAPDAVTFHQSSLNLVLPNKSISGAGGIVKTGAGSLTLNNGSSSYAGGTAVNEGTLVVNASAGAGTSEGGNCTVGLMTPTNVVTINNGATLSINGTAPFGNSLQLPQFCPSIVVNAGGAIQGNTFVAFLPNLTLNGGSILVGAGNTTGGFNTNLGLVGTVTVAGNTPSTISTPVAGANGKISLGAGAAENNGVDFSVANVTGDSNVDFTISSIIRNAGTNALNFSSPLVKSGPGTMLLSGINSYTGTTTVAGGELILAAASLADTAGVVIADGATLNLTHGALDTAQTLTIAGVQLPAGTYGSAGTANPHITGTGASSSRRAPPRMVMKTGLW